MAYREASTPTEELLEQWGVLTGEGAALVGLLGALALALLVALGVSVFVGMPPALRPWRWTLPVGALVLGGPAALLHARRRRALQLVRSGARVRLVVPGATELELPLVLSGTQLEMEMRGIVMHHVYLKLVDGRGRGLLLLEVRGAVYGAQAGWFETIDREVSADRYDVRALGDLARIRARIEEANAALGVAV